MMSAEVEGLSVLPTDYVCPTVETVDKAGSVRENGQLS